MYDNINNIYFILFKFKILFSDFERCKTKKKYDVK